MHGPTNVQKTLEDSELKSYKHTHVQNALVSCMNIIPITYCRFQIKFLCNWKNSSLHYIKYNWDSVLCNLSRVLMCREQCCTAHGVGLQNINVVLFLCARAVVCPGAKVYAHNMSHPGDWGSTSDTGGTQHELRRTGRVSLRLGLSADSPSWGRVWGGWTVVRTRAFLWRWGLYSFCV